MKTGIKIVDAMTANPISVNADENVLNCVKKMIDEQVGSVLVVDETKLLGIVTERDLLNKVIAKNVDLKKTPISEVMSKKPIYAEPELDIYDAMVLMRIEEIRRLPVVDKGIIVGLLTQKDILSIQPELYDIVIESFKIREGDRKSSLNGIMEGNCYACNSHGPLTKIGGKWLCDSCKE
jgi:signal-transduction protein with cAMP-binding, CBS, and nucleotidyltransferase domain